MMTLQKYYVYLILDPTDFYSPFYVGKGSGDRMYAHLQENSKGENRFKDNKIAKIQKSGAEPCFIKWAENLDEDIAYELEKSLIERFGRRNIDKDGILTNICIDARPPSPLGREVSEETKRKIGDKQRGELNHRFGKAIKEQERQIKSKIAKEKGIKPPIRSGPMSEEQKKKISEANKGKKRSPEVSAKLSELRRGKKRGPLSPETIEKIRQSNLGIKKRKMTDIEKEIHAERIRKTWDERRLKYGPSGRPKK